MGFGTTKKKKVAYTSSSRMIGDEDLPNSMRKAILDYVLESDPSGSTNGASVVDYLRRARDASLPIKARKLLRWAKRDRYHYGYPVAQEIDFNTADIDGAVELEIEGQLGHAVDRVYVEFGDINLMHMTWYKLIRDFAYNPNTNILGTYSTSVGTNSYVEDITIKYFSTNDYLSPEYLEPLGWAGTSGATATRARNLAAEHTPWVVDTSQGHDFAEIKYSFQTVETVVRTLVTDNTTEAVISDTTETTPPSGITLPGDAVITGTSTSSSSTESVVGNEKTVITTTYNYTNYRASFLMDFLEFTFSGEVTDGLDASDTENINPNAVPSTLTIPADYDWFSAGYTWVDGGVTKIGYFTYAYGTGGNTTLDTLFTATATTGNFYPRLYARLDGVKLNDDSLKDTPAYKTSRLAGKKLGFKWTKWVDALHENVGSLEEVKDMFLSFCIAANTTNQLEQEYLYRYFAKLYPLTTPITTLTEYQPFQEESVEFAVHLGKHYDVGDDTYRQAYRFDWLGRKEHTGVKCPVGKYESEYGTTTDIVGSGVLEKRYKKSYHSYFYQVDSNTYIEYRVYDIVVSHLVAGQMWTTATGQSEDLLLPLDDLMRNEFSFQKMETIIGRSMHIIINTVKIIKIKWYAREGFKIIMAVIVVVVSILFPPAGAGLYSGFAAIAYAVAYGIAVSVIVSIAVTFAVKLLVRLGVNAEFAAIIVFVVAVIFGGGANAGKALVTAKDILYATNLALQAYGKATSIELKDISRKFDDLRTEIAAKQEALNEMQYLMGRAGSVEIDLETILNRTSSLLITAGETPDMFLSRTTGIGNPGIMVLDMVSSYVDMKSQLPTPLTTLNS